MKITSRKLLLVSLLTIVIAEMTIDHFGKQNNHVLIASTTVVEGVSTGELCGTERWGIKTLTDKEAGSVNHHIKDTTISELIATKPPKKLPEDGRIDPVEYQMYRVPVQLVGWKQEADSDFHIVGRDPANPKAHMIFEIPAAGCANNLTKSGELRDWISKQSHAKAKVGSLYLFKPQIVLKFIGVGFYDKCHGQTGRAPNCIELHPVVDKEN